MVIEALKVLLSIEWVIFLNEMIPFINPDMTDKQSEYYPPQSLQLQSLQVSRTPDRPLWNPAWGCASFSGTFHQ